MKSWIFDSAFLFISPPGPKESASSEDSFPPVPPSVGTHGNLYICIEHTVQ